MYYTRPLTYCLMTLLACAASLAERTAHAAIIELKTTAVVENTVIRLGDVADITQADPIDIDQWSKITLAPTPPSGRPLKIDFDLIQSRLSAHGVNMTTVEFRGARAVTVNPAASTDPWRKADGNSRQAFRDSLRKRAEQGVITAFHRQVSNRRGEEAVQLQLQFDDQDVAVLAAIPAGHLRFRDTNLQLGGPQPLTIIVPDGKGRDREVTVQVTLSMPSGPWAVKANIQKGQVLQAADLIRLPSNDVAGIEEAREIIGKEATRNLRPNQALQPNDLVDVPLVRKGDIVTAAIRRPGMVIRREFRALTDGALDETVSLVALDDSRDKVSARVVGYHSVSLISGPLPSPTPSGNSNRGPTY